MFEWPLPLCKDPAEALRTNGDFAAAEALARSELARHEKEKGRGHPDSLVFLDSLGTTFTCLKRLDEAESAYSESFASSEKALGSEHPATLARASNHALMLSALGWSSKAVAILEKVVETRRRLLGETELLFLTTEANLAIVLGIGGKTDRANELFRSVLEKMSAAVEPDNLRLETVKFNYNAVRNSKSSGRGGQGSGGGPRRYH